MKYLNKEINLNLKVIVIVLFMCIVSLGLYTSYAYFQISVIQDNIIVISTKNIIVNTEVVDNTNQTFTLLSGETKTITVNLTTEEENNIGYKIYYDVTNGISNFIVTSTETFTNDIVEGIMNTSKTINLTFENTGSNDITIKLGTQGGIEGYIIDLDEGLELKLNETLGAPLKSAILNSIENPTDTSCKTYVEEDGITYISGTSDCIYFNYVWYSGKLWRITSINEDGTMKLITDDIITTISYNSSGNVAFYTDENTNSYMYQWLNQDFLSTLYNYENIIETDASWYSLTTSSISTKINSTVDGITTYTVQ